MERYLTQKEIIEIFGVSRQTIYDWRKNGMPYFKIKRLIMFKMSDVEKWMKQTTKENEEMK